MQRLLRALLTDEGYAVSQAEDGAVALEVLRTSLQPMVVVLNTTAPRDGMSLLQHAAASEPAVSRHAVVLLTALADRLPLRWRQLVDTLGALVVGKPFGLLTVLDAVATASERLMDIPPRATGVGRVVAAAGHAGDGDGAGHADG